MMRKKLVATSTTVAAVAAMTLALAGTASADLTTRCDGEGGAVTIPTDLIVPAGKTCLLTGTVIQGDVRVGAGADLIAEDVTIEGAVRVNGNAYFETFDTSVSGQVTMRGAFGSYLTTSDLGSDVNARPGGGYDSAGFVLAEEVDSMGRVVVDTGELLLETSDVAGDVIVRDSLYADVYDTFIDGELRSLRNEQGSVVCSSVIQGEARFVDNMLSVQLGGDGPLVECDGSSYWGSDVRVIGTTGGVFLDDNIANGDVILRNNDPIAQIGTGNMVRGDVIGDFEAAPSMAALSKSKVSARAAQDVVAREDAVDAKIDARRSDAIEAAEAAGPAF